MSKPGDNIHVETVYPGVNVGCIVTAQGSICVDTPLLPGEAQRWRMRIGSLDGEPVRFVVYTNGQRDRILGTQYLIDAPQGAVAWSGLANPPQPMPKPTRRQKCSVAGMGSPSVIAHVLAWPQVQNHRTDNFKQSMVDMLAERDPDIVHLQVIPPQITLNQNLKLYLGDEQVTLIAAAPGMLWVWLPWQGVLFVGDTVVVGTHPPLLVTDTKEWLAALARLRRESRFRDAVLVPGRGPLCDVSATEPLTEYLRRARDRTRRIYRAGRPKSDLNSVAADLLSLYPVADGQNERVQRQIKLGLDELYDQFKTAETTEEDME